MTTLKLDSSNSAIIPFQRSWLTHLDKNGVAYRIIPDNELKGSDTCGYIQLEISPINLVRYFQAGVNLAMNQIAPIFNNEETILVDNYERQAI